MPFPLIYIHAAFAPPTLQPLKRIRRVNCSRQLAMACYAAWLIFLTDPRVFLSHALYLQERHSSKSKSYANSADLTHTRNAGHSLLDQNWQIFLDFLGGHMLLLKGLLKQLHHRSHAEFFASGD